MLPGRQYTPEELLRLLWYRRWIIIVFAIFTTLGAVALSMQIKNIYMSETLILVIPQRVPESYVKTTMTVRIEDRLRSIKEEILSRTRLEKVINDFNLYPELRAQKPMEEVVEMHEDEDRRRHRPRRRVQGRVHLRLAADRDDRRRPAGRDVHRRERARPGSIRHRYRQVPRIAARRRAPPPRGAREQAEAVPRALLGRAAAAAREQPEMIRSSQMQIQSLNESIDRDRDRRLALEKSISDALQRRRRRAGRRSQDRDRARSARQGQGRAARAGAAVEAGASGRDRQAQARGDARTPGQDEAPPVSARRHRAKTGVARHRPPGARAPVPAGDGQARQADRAEADRRRSPQERGHRLPAARRLGARARVGADRADARLRDAAEGLHDLLAKKEDSKISANLERQQIGEQFKILDPARLPERPFSPNRVRITLIGVWRRPGARPRRLAGFLEYRDTTLRTEDEVVKMLVLPVLAAIPVMIVGRRAAAPPPQSRARRGVASLMLVAGALVGMLWRIGLVPGLR